MSGRKRRVIDLIGEPRINLVSPEGSPEPHIKKEPTPSPPEPKVVTSGLAISVPSKIGGVKVVESASSGAAGGSAISMPGAAAEARRVSFETAQIRNDAEAGWKAACGQADPEAKGPAPTVVKPEAGAGETTEESSSEEEERPRAGGKMRVHKPPGPRRNPYER